MTWPRFVLAMGALAVLGCGSAQVADQRASDAGAEAGDAEPDTAAEAASDAGPDAAPFPGCPTGDGGFLQPTFPEKRLSVGWDHACGIRDDGTVECWGDVQAGTFYGYTVPPAGTFIRVAAGLTHTCGIRMSGEVECWGAGKTNGVCPPDCGQSMPPPGKFIEIAAGDDSTCGLRPDCTIECWGNVGAPGPPAGQFVQMDVWNSGCAVAPGGHGQCWADFASLADVKQVSLGEFCDCYLDSHNVAKCSFYRQAQTSPPHSYVDTWSPSGVSSVSCGPSHACAILDDGTMACDACAMLGDGTIACDSGPGPSGTFTEVSCGFGFCCGMHTDGTAECFGGGSPGVPPDFPKGP